jgi:hypothetical protein
MANHDFFSHTSQDGRALSQRIDASGDAWSTHRREHRRRPDDGERRRRRLDLGPRATAPTS